MVYYFWRHKGIIHHFAHSKISGFQIFIEDLRNVLTTILNRVNITHNLRERRDCDAKTCNY